MMTGQWNTAEEHSKTVVNLPALQIKVKLQSQKAGSEFCTKSASLCLMLRNNDVTLLTHLLSFFPEFSLLDSSKLTQPAVIFLTLWGSDHHRSQSMHFLYMKDQIREKTRVTNEQRCLHLNCQLITVNSMSSHTNHSASLNHYHQSI